MTDMLIDYSSFTGRQTAENDDVARQRNPQQQTRGQAEIERQPTYFQKTQECARPDASSWSGASFGGGTFAGRSRGDA
jgi:hypothetical protein